MTEPTRPKAKAPAGLNATGKALWRRLAAAFDFEPHELAVLELCCRQAEDVAALEVLIARDGMVVAGSAGQPRLNAAVAEVRQGRLALGKLLGQLGMPDEDNRPASPAAKHARHAAEHRWTQERQKAARRERLRSGPTT